MKTAATVALFTLALGLSACSSGPTPLVATKPASDILPAGKYYSTKKSKDGALHILRDFSMTGVACKTIISLNNQPVAKLGASENVTLYVSAGEVFIGAQSGCIRSEATQQLVQVEAGKDYFFRTGFTDVSTSLHLYRSSPF
ncbi:hypothetical protein SAMN04488103_103310 [Gemmobacter aquatilis]|uniref:DUF2846 domain-containing protein n=1 Tax=Gemmobacter aquatilis TaxID=933059 RepID=A0A1H8EGE8_9RHOB|nr:hypothetical protein [Gemmobacter aquatilis]SEN18460.1 hypothetical protein SAMN04488103_103310 [Gemmobacter aquatilis]